MIARKEQVDAKSIARLNSMLHCVKIIALVAYYGNSYVLFELTAYTHEFSQFEITVQSGKYGKYQVFINKNLFNFSINSEFHEDFGVMKAFCKELAKAYLASVTT